MKRGIAVIAGALAAVFVLLCFTGCEDNTKAEYTPENNTDIADIISRLKKDYSLADTDKNSFVLRGDKTGQDTIENGSVEFNLYFGINDREKVTEGVTKALEDISGMCSQGSFSTVLCRVYMKTDEGYVDHDIGSYYNRGENGNVTVSLTEYDWDDLGNAYEQLKSEYGIKPHRTWTKDGTGYSQPAFEIQKNKTGNWSCKATMSFDSPYTKDELKEIGEKVYSLLGDALENYASGNNEKVEKTNYDINVFGQHEKLHGDNKSDPDKISWEG